MREEEETISGAQRRCAFFSGAGECVRRPRTCTIALLYSKIYTDQKEKETPEEDEATQERRHTNRPILFGQSRAHAWHLRVEALFTRLTMANVRRDSFFSLFQLGVFKNYILRVCRPL